MAEAKASAIARDPLPAALKKQKLKFTIPQKNTKKQLTFPSEYHIIDKRCD